MSSLSLIKIVILSFVLSVVVSCQPKQPSSQEQEAAEVVEPSGFVKDLEYKSGVSFAINATDTASLNTLVITPSGQEINNDPFTHEIDGKVYNAEVADLNGDGFPEVLVYISGAGSGSYGSLIAYSSNKGKSMSQAFVADIMEDEAVSQGYMGHDAFTIADGLLTRRFPIYNEGDVNATPSGYNRQITYKLIDGEASRLFVVEKVIKYKAG